MHLTYRNVDHAYKHIMTNWGDYFIVSEDSRNGPVFVCPELLAITYQHPWERVVTDPTRDANPFFHVVESIWMLAGRNTISPLDYFVKDISKFSDDGVTFNGAYGYRWRRSWIDMEATAAFDMPGQNVDQLDTIIKHLSRTPHSRRAVLDMWQVQDDLLKVDTSKDVCCNLSAVFQIHGGDLHMTVYNRSNDVILGMLGANAVHFSYLQEYIANSLNLSMGPYTQVSCNAHVYKSHVDKYLHTAPTCHDNEYWDEIGTYWLDPATDFQFCTNVIDSWVQGNGMPLDVCDYFEDVLEPMCIAYAHHKARDYDSALRTALDIRDLQWANACIDWILRRKANWQRNTTLPPNTEGISPKELDDVQWMMGSGRYYQ